MEKVCYIFGAGDLYEENITIPDNAFVIAADAGCGLFARLHSNEG